MELLQLQRCCMCLEAHAALEDVCQWPGVRWGVFLGRRKLGARRIAPVKRLAFKKKKQHVLCFPKDEAKGS